MGAFEDKDGKRRRNDRKTNPEAEQKKKKRTAGIYESEELRGRVGY